MRLCLEPRCPDPAHYRGRCKTHARHRNRETRSKNAGVYNTKRWKILRRHKLKLNPICEQCDGELATDVHHIVDLADGGEPFSLTNLESLCHACHSQVTRRRQQ